MAERALNTILEDINTSIKTVSFGSKITTRGLCYLQEKDGKTFPVENKDTRNALMISWDDKYPLQTYHRILGVEKETDVTQGFGKNASMTRVYTMRLVGIGNKTSLSVAAYEDNQEIAKTIADAVPAFITSKEYAEVIGMEVIKQEVYNSEFAGIEVKKLSLEGIAFWIDYELKLTNCGVGQNFDNSSTVRNTDNSYSTSVNCKQELVIPDITITKLDDTTITYPAAKNLDIGDIDSCTTPATFDQLVTLVGRGYTYPEPTGQTISYRTGDDAWVEANIFSPIRAANDIKAKNSLSNFTTLNHNNAFGNTNRFTDENGLQVYGSGYMIDHYTGMGWDRTFQPTGLDWNGCIDDGLAHALLSYTDWFLPSMGQYYSIMNWGAANAVFLSALGNSDFGNIVLTSTTYATTTTLAIRWSNQIGLGGTIEKTSTTGRYYLCRKHY